MYIYTLNSDSNMGKFDFFVMSAILDNVKEMKEDNDTQSNCTLDSNETTPESSDLNDTFKKQLAQIRMTVKFKELYDFILNIIRCNRL